MRAGIWMGMNNSSFDRVVCPGCRQSFDLQQAWDDNDARRFVELMTSIPAPLIRPLYQYIKLFKPEKQSLRWSRILKITQELVPMILDAEINRNGISYVVPVVAWEKALASLVTNRPDSLALPLTKNAYLLSMLANEAEKGAAIQEKKVDQKRRDRVQPGAQKGMQSAGALFKPPGAGNKKNKPPAGWRGESLSAKKGRDA